MAHEMLRSRTAIKEEHLRGVDISSLVAGGARLFADGGTAAKEDPVGVYALSQPVPRLDFFISHSWKSSRYAKYFALLCHFNLKAAILAYVLTGFFCLWYATLFFETLPAFFVLPPQPKFIDNVSLRCCFFAELFCPLAYVAVFFFGHHILRSGQKAFLE